MNPHCGYLRFYILKLRRTFISAAVHRKQPRSRRKNRRIIRIPEKKAIFTHEPTSQTDLWHV